MTDLTPIKTMLVAAFNAQGEASGFSEYVYDRGDGDITLDGRFNLDRLAAHVMAHADLFRACPSCERRAGGPQ